MRHEPRIKARDEFSASNFTKYDTMSTFIGYSYKQDVVGKPPKGDAIFSTLKDGWIEEDSCSAVERLIKAVESGVAIAPGLYHQGTKTKAQFVAGQLVLLDFDGTMDWGEAKNNRFFQTHCIGAFTTASHRDEPGGHRFRVLGIWPKACTSAQEYDGKLVGLRNHLKAEGFADDDTSMQSAQCSFGNPAAEIVWWDLNNRLPDIAPPEAPVRERGELVEETSEDLDLKAKKAAHCLKYISPRMEDGSGTYPDAFKALTVLVNELGEELTLQVVDQCNWWGLWDIEQKIQSILADAKADDEQARLGTLIELARNSCSDDELVDFEAGLTELNRVGFEELAKVDVADLFPVVEGYKAPKCGIETRKVINKDGEESYKIFLVDTKGKEHDITYSSNRTLMNKHLIKAVDVVSSDTHFRYNIPTRRVVRDDDEISPDELETIHLTLSDEYSINFPKDTKGAILALAMRDPFDPYVEELERIEREAEPIDISNIASRYFKTEEPLADVMMEKWLVGLVTRLMKPGTYLRQALVVVGAQNIGKDYFVNTLCGGEGRVISVGRDAKLKDKDFLGAVNSGWVANLDEIERVTASQVQGELKSWLTAHEDVYTLKYENAPRKFPRRFSIYGSCNHAKFLQDPSGNTRFWVIESPLKRGEKIDLELLAKERDGILAGAMRLFRLWENGQYSLNLSEEEMAKSEENNGSYVEDAPYVEKLSHLLEERTTTCWAEVTDYLGLSDARSLANKQLTNSVKASLDQLGFEANKSPRKVRKDGHKTFSVKVFLKTGYQAETTELHEFYESIGQVWWNSKVSEF